MVIIQCVWGPPKGDNTVCMGPPKGDNTVLSGTTYGDNTVCIRGHLWMIIQCV